MSDQDSFLMMRINGVTYALNSVVPELPETIAAWRFTKEDGETYVASSGTKGLKCECGDFHWRKEGTDEFCKHLTALIRHGLL